MLRKIFILLVFLVVQIALGLPTFAADFVCEPTEVAVYKSRIHVKCSTSATDGQATIWFWAVSTADTDHANHFLSTATTALIAGRNLKISYTPGDTSGQSFGCQANDCRVPWAITIY